MSESKLRDLSVDFSVNAVKLCEKIKGHYSLVNQLERSATSIGANIHEANYARGFFNEAAPSGLIGDGWRLRLEKLDLFTKVWYNYS